MEKFGGAGVARAMLAVFFVLLWFRAVDAGESARVFGDPHFVGWDGVSFDFTGQPDRTYCMLSDLKLHINMNLQGRYDRQGGRNVTRTWIKALGIMDGIHRISLFAREGADLSHTQSYLDRIEVDGTEIKLSLGQTYTSEDKELSVTYDSISQDTVTPFDRYTVSAKDLAKIILTARPEIPDLRDTRNAYFHLAVELMEAKLSSTVHGVLGQTYANARGRKHDASYKTTWNNLLLSQQVDGANGDGYLDGTVSDYEATGLLHSDCRYSRFDVNPENARTPVVQVSSGYARKYLRGSFDPHY